MTKYLAIIFLIIVSLRSLYAQDKKLSEDYLATYWSPTNNLSLSIKSDNQFRLSRVENSGSKIKENTLAIGQFTIENDSITLISKHEIIGKFLILEHLALKPLYYFIPETADLFLLQNKFDLNGRYLGQGTWQNDEKLGIWIYSDKRYKDIKSPKTKRIRYNKIKNLSKAK